MKLYCTSAVSPFIQHPLWVPRQRARDHPAESQIPIHNTGEQTSQFIVCYARQLLSASFKAGILLLVTVQVNAPHSQRDIIFILYIVTIQRL